MKKINKLIVVFFSILLFAGSGIAVAACNQAEAKGTWRVNGMLWGEVGIEQRTTSIKCKFKLGSGGGISASKSSCKIFDLDSVGSVSTLDVTGGRLVIAKNCTISGQLTVTDGGLRIRSGQMDRSKNSFTILAVDTDAGTTQVFFDGKRQ